MIDFAKCFELLTGNPPFKWQKQLYKKFLTDKIPSSCDIPTGLGKTSVIAIWLFALAENLSESPGASSIPRRLVYVVDRRVIVDQATDEAERILRRLKDFENSENEDLRKFFAVLRDSSFYAERQSKNEKAEDEDKNVVALSTLRGEFADNREWCLDPSRPAIIVGTIDMIGSRLLFSAYGRVGKNHKSLQAGLLGQDSLIVIDEAHLSPAFVKLLQNLKVNLGENDLLKPFNLMLLSATLPTKTDIPTNSDVFRVDETDEDVKNNASIVNQRFFARKEIKLKEFSLLPEGLKGQSATKNFRAAQVDAIVEEATTYSDDSAVVVIYVKEVETVKLIITELVAKLASENYADAENRVLAMTGGMRGKERDEITEDEIFKKFAPKQNREKPDGVYFLVATSTAEVGVNLDADHAICDLTSLDSLTQRIGRVNRFGNGAAKIAVVFSPQQIVVSEDYFAGIDAENVAEEILNKANEKYESIGDLVEAEKQKQEQAKENLKTAKAAQIKVNKKSDETTKIEAEKAKRFLDEAKQQSEITAERLKQAREKMNSEKEKVSVAKKELDKIKKNLEELGKIYVRPLALDEAEIFTYKKLEQNLSEERINASPFALKKLAGDARCYPLAPICPPLDAARIDDWAMTSASGKDFPRSQVAAWLRGVISDETTETRVCWRADLKYAISEEDTKKMLGLVPVASRETARETTFRARELIKIIANELEDRKKDESFYVIDTNGDVQPHYFEKFVTAKKRNGEKVSTGEKNRVEAKLFEILSFATVILPCEVGGLDKGLIVGEAKKLLSEKSKEIKKVDDVAEDDKKDDREKSWLRLVFEQDGKGFTVKRLASGEIFEDFADTDRTIDEIISDIEKRTGKVCVHQSQAVETEESEAEELEDVAPKETKRKPFVAYFAARKSPDRLLRDDDTASISTGKVKLETHNNDVEDYARRIAEKLSLPADLVDALAIAGKWHDVGKNRAGWQRAIGNREYPKEVLAKSGHNRFNHHASKGYRHEFGSLIEAEEDESVKTHPRRDLILHLIAAHHGWARPHFPERAFDPKQPNPLSRRKANEAMRRFAKLQNEFGWWQLAYLEAILKAADALASRDRVGE